MSLTHYYVSPFGGDAFGMDRSVRQMLGEMDRAMSAMYGRSGSPGAVSRSGSGERAMGSLRVDVRETDKAFEIKCDVPGIPKESIHLECRDNGLLISGQTKKEEEKDEGTMHVRERFEGSFQRLIPMPAAANLDAVRASFMDGVLQVTVPKKEIASGKKIAIE